jgi:hypothetical protein
MHLRWNLATAALAGVLVAGGLASAESPKPQSAQEVAFEQHCAVCHKIRPREHRRARHCTRCPRALSSEHSPAASCRRKAQLCRRPSASRSQNTLPGKSVGTRSTLAGRCTRPSPFSPNAASYNGWGGNLENWRFQAKPGISATQLSKLEVKWAFGVPARSRCSVSRRSPAAVCSSARKAPTCTRSTRNRAATTGIIYAPTTGVRTAITVARIRGGKKNCSPAQSAAVTATPGYVLCGSVDGHLRAYATADGKVLWDFNTARKFATVDGIQAL